MKPTEKNVLIGVSVFASLIVFALAIYTIPALRWIIFLLLVGFVFVGVIALAVSYYANNWDRIQNERQAAKKRREEDHRIALEQADAHRRQREDEDRRYRESIPFQLRQEPWRDYRGMEFEEFVGKVFRANGVNADVTRGSGDQGVDVLAFVGSCRLAIQVKGYSGSVGNSAVQEVVAGVRHYKCSHSAVVTNSRFTSSALNLAKSNNVWMVSEESMENLILGTHPIYKIFPNESEVVLDAEVLE